MHSVLMSVLGAGNYGNPGPTPPSPQVSQAFNTLVGDLKWVAGGMAIIGVIVLGITGVVAHKRGEHVMDAFGGFVKIIGLLIVISSAVTLVTAFLG